MKKAIALLSCLVLMIALVSSITVSASDPSSTAISDAAGLLAIANNPTGTYHLTNDIDLAGITLGADTGNLLPAFDGILDGQGYSIFNFKFEFTGTTDAALIGKLGANANATIKNLNIGKPESPVVYDITVTGKSFSALAAVTNNNNVEHDVVIDNVNIYADLEVIRAANGKLKGNLGGFVAYTCKKGTLTISNSSMNGVINFGTNKVDYMDAQSMNLAGFVSANNVNLSIIDCVNNATLVNGPSSKEARAAGFVAYAGTNPISLTNCLNLKDITVLDIGDTKSDARIGGIVADFNVVTTIAGCTNVGKLTGSNKVGAIAGYAQKNVTITDCVNYGILTATSSDIAVGAVKSETVLVNNTGFLDKTGETYNPGTGDAVVLAVIAMALSFFGIVSLVLYKKKKVND